MKRTCRRRTFAQIETVARKSERDSVAAFIEARAGQYADRGEVATILRALASDIRADLSTKEGAKP